MSVLNLELNVLEGVTFFYAKVKNPSKKYQSQTEYEYSVDVQVDKATAKAWNKAFPKQKAKEIDYDVFVEKFGEHNAIGTEEQFTIKLKKDAQYKDKQGVVQPLSDRYRPRAFEANSDGTLTDITFTKLVGGGSKGAALFEVNTNDFGTFAKFVGIRVDTLVEVSSDDGAKYNALGKVSELAAAPAHEPASTHETETEAGEGTEVTGTEDDQWK